MGPLLRTAIEVHLEEEPREGDKKEVVYDLRAFFITRNNHHTCYFWAGASE